MVEVDGGVHEQQVDYDESRAEVFTQWGISILRVTNEEVLEEFEKTLACIKEICQVRGGPLPQPLPYKGRGLGGWVLLRRKRRQEIT